MALLKANIVSAFQSQELLNTLWYETVPSNPVGIDFVSAARGLGEWVRDNICAGAVGQTRLVNVIPADTSIQRIEVMAYNPPPPGSANPVELINTPQVTQVGLLSGNPTIPAFAPQACYIMRLVCAAQTLNPLDYTPRGGYLALGPASELSVLSSGEIEQGTITALSNFGAALLAVATLGSGFTANPIRVGARRAGNVGGLATFGWAVVTAAIPSNRVSWRRSRSPR